MSRYLTTHDVEVMHHVLIERYGGSLGLRDLGRFSSTVWLLCGYAFAGGGII